jgi:preprotein translocase subunit YajC
MVNKDTIVIETSDDRVRIELTKWAVSTVGGVQSSEMPVENKKKDKDAEAVAEEKKD